MLIAILLTTSALALDAAPILETTLDYPAVGMDRSNASDTITYGNEMAAWLVDFESQEIDLAYCAALITQFNLTLLECGEYQERRNDACSVLEILAHGQAPCNWAILGLEVCKDAATDMMEAYVDNCIM